MPLKRNEPATAPLHPFPEGWYFVASRKALDKAKLAMEKSDVLQDVPIWSRKQYRARPKLARSDGEIRQYRAYCAQFYPDTSAEVDDTETVVNLRAAGDR